MFLIDSTAVAAAVRIGIAAAYGLVVAMQPYRSATKNEFDDALAAAGARLRDARPTAVNLGWAVDRIAASAQRPENGATQYARIKAAAEKIHAEDRAMCHAIGRAGMALITR